MSNLPSTQYKGAMNMVDHVARLESYVSRLAAMSTITEETSQVEILMSPLGAILSICLH